MANVNLTLKDLHIFRGTYKECMDQKTEDMKIYLAWDTQELFVGNKYGVKVKYGGAKSVKTEVMTMLYDFKNGIEGHLKEYATEQFRLEIQPGLNKIDTDLNNKLDEVVKELNDSIDDLKNETIELIKTDISETNSRIDSHIEVTDNKFNEINDKLIKVNEDINSLNTILGESNEDTIKKLEELLKNINSLQSTFDKRYAAKGDTYTKSEVNNKLTDLKTSIELGMAPIHGALDEKIDTVSAKIDTEISNVRNDVNTEISNVRNDIPTKVSQLENDRGYLTEHQSLDNYATKDELFSGSYNDLTDKPEIPSIEGLATETYVSSTVKSAIDAIVFPETVIANPDIPSDAEKYNLSSIKIGGKYYILPERPVGPVVKEPVKSEFRLSTSSPLRYKVGTTNDITINISADNITAVQSVSFDGEDITARVVSGVSFTKSISGTTSFTVNYVVKQEDDLHTYSATSNTITFSYYTPCYIMKNGEIIKTSESGLNGNHSVTISVGDVIKFYSDREFNNLYMNSYDANADESTEMYDGISYYVYTIRVVSLPGGVSSDTVKFTIE